MKPRTENTAFINAIRMIMKQIKFDTLYPVLESLLSHIKRENPQKTFLLKLSFEGSEPIHLQTAGFVQACQHFSTGHLQMFCQFNHLHVQKLADVLSQSIPSAYIHKSFIEGHQYYHC